MHESYLCKGFKQMFFDQCKKHFKKLQIILWLFILTLNFSCAYEKKPSIQMNQIKIEKEDTVFIPKISEAILIQTYENNNPLLPIKTDNALNTLFLHDEHPVKLICIPNSLSYLSLIINNYDLKGYIQEGKLYIQAPEMDLIRHCENKLNSLNLNLHIAKLGVRYNSKDFELNNLYNIPNKIKVTRDFIDSLVTDSITDINIYCADNNKVLSNSSLNFISLNAKPYYEPYKNKQKSLFIDKHNILFINLNRTEVLNQNYKFNRLQFNECKSIYAINHASNIKYQKIYFIGDNILPQGEDKFLIEKVPSRFLDTKEQSYLVCYFVDENGKLNWHWSLDSKTPIAKSLVDGIWVNGVFETNSDKNKFEKTCKSFSTKYLNGKWKLFNVEVADNFWSWSSPIKFNSQSGK